MNKIPGPSILEYPDWSQADSLLARPSGDLSFYRTKVAAMLESIKTEGDMAVRRLAQQFDQLPENAELRISEAQINAAGDLLTPELRAAIRQAYSNIYTFHAAQKEQFQPIETMPGVVCTRKSVGIERVGLYIPGGTAPLFSTVLMLGIPAQIAGCRSVVLCTPPGKDGEVHPAVLFAAQLCGIHQVFRVGGVQAIGAMAYGTGTVPRVWKIFGPGNAWVTAAKQLISLEGVAIDMPAGPSEVAVMADSSANPVFVAADLLSQAEHGSDSQVLLVSDNRAVLEGVLEELPRQLARLPRGVFAEEALSKSRFLLVKNLEEAMLWVNEYAPEHLILSVNNPEYWAEQVINAGSVFLGHFTPESAGDYASGTNHTLPTSGFARVYAGVSVDSFVKKITYQQITRIGLEQLGPVVIEMAEAEGLRAHAEAVRVRLAVANTQDEEQQSSVQSLLRTNIRALKPYSSARDEAPDTDEPAERIYLDANENSLGSPISGVYHRYPDPQPMALKQELARLKQVTTDQIFVGNGSDEAIDLLIRAFCEPGRDNIVILPPTYGMYAVQANIHGAEVRRAALNPDFSPNAAAVMAVADSRSKILFICSPNNPTGNSIPESFILDMLARFPGIVVVDEAYIDFSKQPSWTQRIGQFPRLVVLQTLSKAWGLAGLRIGMAYAQHELIEVLNKIKYPYNINLATAALAVEALGNQDLVQQKITTLCSERDQLATKLAQISTVREVFPSDANFLLIRIDHADAVYERLAQAGIIVRNRSKEMHCGDCLRITIGTPEENAVLVRLLSVISY
jgi:histidinol dehydrogenase